MDPKSSNLNSSINYFLPLKTNPHLKHTQNMSSQRIFQITAKVIACLMLFIFMTITSARVLNNQESLPYETAKPELPPADAKVYHTFSFSMHNIQGGLSPSSQAITGIVNSRIPFANPYSAFVNNNNIPFLTLNSECGPPIYDITTLRKLMFGTITVDDELTSGQELELVSVGKAQGFYIASSEDGRCQVFAFTAMFESGGYADSLSFFGLHMIGVSESHLAIMGGTGKYVNAKGYTVLNTLPSRNHDLTNGIETLLEFTVYATS